MDRHARSAGSSPSSYFSARSGAVSGTVSSRIRRDSKLDSAGIHERARLTYDLSLGNRVGGVQPVSVPYFYRTGPPRFLCPASPRPRAVSEWQGEERDIVIIVPELLEKFSNFSTFSNSLSSISSLS